MAKGKSLELLLFLVVVFWGANYTVGKWGMLGFSPLNFTLLRFAVAAPLLLLMLYLLERDLRVSLRDLPQMALIGLVGTAIYQTVFMAAVKYASAANASLLLAASPVFTAIFAGVARQETLPARGRWGSVLALGGVVLVLVFGTTKLKAGSGAWLGDMYGLLASGVWGLYPVLTHKMLRRYSALKTVAVSSLFGALFLLAAGLPGLLRVSWPGVPWQSWASLLYSIGPVTVFGLVAWYYGISKVGANRVMAYMYLVPVVAVATAAVMLGEGIHPLQILGAAVIFVGIQVIRSGKKMPAGTAGTAATAGTTGTDEVSLRAGGDGQG
ncbi:putative amino-acid metabolite efflux pump [Peptococcaceae bacterium CEB3]|nr:putative amino-acid metabolite efflux pump [Peptococcaceae bacterium CEB3]